MIGGCVRAVTADPDERRYHPDCTCSDDHTGQVCTSAGFEVAPSYQAVTAEYIEDISGDDEEQFYLSTQDMYRLHRYEHADIATTTLTRCYHTDTTTQVAVTLVETRLSEYRAS